MWQALTAKEGEGDSDGGKDCHSDRHAGAPGIEIDSDEEVSEGSVGDDAGVGEKGLHTHGSMLGVGIPGITESCL